jgi:predicted deacylase
MLNYLDMLPGEVLPKSTIMIRESSWVRAKVSGIFSSNVRLGDEVKKGQIIAKITDPYGQVKLPVKATNNGHVVGLNNNPVVNAGMPSFMLDESDFYFSLIGLISLLSKTKKKDIVYLFWKSTFKKVI